MPGAISKLQDVIRGRPEAIRFHLASIRCMQEDVRVTLARIRSLLPLIRKRPEAIRFHPATIRCLQ